MNQAEEVEGGHVPLCCSCGSPFYLAQCVVAAAAGAAAVSGVAALVMHTAPAAVFAAPSVPCH